MINFAFVKETGFVAWAHRQAVWNVRKMFSNTIRIELVPGVRMDLPVGSAIAKEIYLTDCDIDWGSELLFSKLIDGSDCVLDCGANIGYYSLYMSPHVERVVAFEPDPRPRKWLKHNTEGKNITVEPLALGDSQGRVKFVLAENSEVSHIGQDNEGIDVDITTIDIYCQKHNLKVSGIKTDLEGYDLRALMGAVDTIRDHKPVILTEAAPDKNLFDFSVELGLSVFAYVRDSRTRKRSFGELTEPPTKNVSTKMLFLVPPTAKQKVLKFAQSQSNC